MKPNREHNPSVHDSCATSSSRSDDMEFNESGSEFEDEDYCGRNGSDDVGYETSPDKRFYRVNRGKGAHKIVFKGIDTETGCEVAWNVISTAGMDKSKTTITSEEIQRVTGEIDLLQKLSHPNIISLRHSWEDKVKCQIVLITDLVSGGTLSQHLKKMGTIRYKVLKKWCLEILRGLEYLHSQQPHPIVHRDLKCDNIFINSHKGTVMIGDLGCASILSNQVTGSVLGTPEYMAPEIFEECYDISVDIYSFGMCVLEMATQLSPFYECKGNPYQVFRKLNIGCKPSSLLRIENQELRDFIEKCIGLPQDRPTASQLLEDEFLKIRDIDNHEVSMFPEAKKENSLKESPKSVLGETEEDDGPKDEVSQLTCLKAKQLEHPLTCTTIRSKPIPPHLEEKKEERETILSPKTSVNEQELKSPGLNKKKSMRDTAHKDNPEWDESLVKKPSILKPSKEQKEVPYIGKNKLCQIELSNRRREKQSQLDDLQLEIRGEELHILNDGEEIESMPIDSLKVSTIHDISRSIMEKLNLDSCDNDDQFRLEYKIGSALRFKEAAANCRDQKRAEESEFKMNSSRAEKSHQDRSLVLDDVLHTEDDQLMRQVNSFKDIYCKEYLDKVLSCSWRDEGVEQMNLRHEAELNQLKKLHTEQKQSLLDEMRQRMDRVRRVERKMKSAFKPFRHNMDLESTSQLMELDSMSMKSREYVLHQDLPDNISRIAGPLKELSDINPKEEIELTSDAIFHEHANLSLNPAFSQNNVQVNNLDEKLNQNESINIPTTLNVLLPGMSPARERSLSTCTAPPPSNSEPLLLCKELYQDIPRLQLTHLLSYDTTIGKFDKSANQPLTERTGDDSVPTPTVYEDILSLRNLSPQSSMIINFEEVIENIEAIPSIQEPITPGVTKDREKEVILLQKSLKILYPESDLTVNGIFAKFTQRLVSRFQESRGINPSGTADQFNPDAVLQIGEKKDDYRFKDPTVQEQTPTSARSKLICKDPTMTQDLKSYEQELIQSLSLGQK